MKECLPMPAQDSESHSLDSSFQPTLGQLGRIERSMLMVSKALHLEMAGLILTDDDTDPRSQGALDAIGKAALRIAALANELSASTGLVSIEQTPATSEPVMPSPTSAPIAQEQTPAPTIESALPATQQPVEEVPSEPTVEAVEQASENKLYDRIVSVEETPFMQLPDGATAIEAIITDDGITINERLIRLAGDRVFIFNSLMLQRQNLITNDMIKQLGFKGDAKAFHAAMKSVIDLLNNTTKDQNIELIKKLGERNTSQYAVNPILQLIEGRNSGEATTNQIVVQDVKKN